AILHCGAADVVPDLGQTGLTHKDQRDFRPMLGRDQLVRAFRPGHDALPRARRTRTAIRARRICSRLSPIAGLSGTRGSRLLGPPLRTGAETLPNGSDAGGQLPDPFESEDRFRITMLCRGLRYDISRWGLPDSYGVHARRNGEPSACRFAVLHRDATSPPMALRKEGTNRGDNSVVGWAGCRVEVRPVHQTTTPPKWLDHPWAKDPDGVFVVDVTAEPSSIYDAMVESPALLQQATVIDPSDH